ncbi:hypothetical protein [Sedimentibacter sp.]|uniref:Stage III sporulation protein AF n=2 Tax=Sedimentibacter hydroxybenzoicus TaxID=29345 RepID=A0A974BIK9_SEDHY|nr:hypothetical protein [Sedimentibacter sp.]NYB73511.1 hypothetical protein [Sedimentibacter hydroxybenzoicus DSM 7310]
MKNTIINIIILILMFNIIMIIFPEGKTQKFCRIAIKIFIMIYILDNIFLNGSININILSDLPVLETNYEREVTLSSIDDDIIESINKDYFEGDDVVKSISLSFTEDMDIKAEITLNKLLSFDEANVLKTNIADIFHIESENIYIR